MSHINTIKVDESSICLGELEVISKSCAERILSHMKELSKTKEKIIIALPGGRSVIHVFKYFKESEEDIWRKIHIFMIDERVADITSEQSNFKLLYDSFLESLVNKQMLPAENIHPFVFDQKRPDMGAHDYFNELKTLGGMIDIILVSSGEDGHIGALYPNHKALERENADYIYLNDSPKPPSRRITASKNLIFNASLSCIIFSGDGKREAYERFRDSKVSTKDCPAKLVLKSKRYMIFTDIIY